MVSAVAAGRAAEALLVEYQLDGEPTAPAVIRGQSRLTGAVIVTPAGTEHHSAHDCAGALSGYADRPRVYDDAILGRTIEHIYGFAKPPMFDDIRVMSRLLEHAGLHQAECEISTSQSPARIEHITEQYRNLPDRLLSAGMGITYAQVELPVIDPTVDMMVAGLNIDRQAIRNLDAATTADMEIRRRQIAEIAGPHFDPDDDRQVEAFLFDSCGINAPVLTPRSGQRSVNAEALRLIGDVHPVVPPLRQYRQSRPVLQALRSLSPHIHEATGRVHGKLDPHGAVTGRFTCSFPNLLGLHRKVRSVVTASPGCTLIEADISQAEFRVLTHFTREPTLVEAFNEVDTDLHRQTIALARGVPADAVSAEERRIGKAVNFGIIYGETEFGLAKDLGVTVDEARRFLDQFFRTRPGVKAWIETVHENLNSTGFVSTMFGRRRALPNIWSRNSHLVREAERQAVNTIIQGTAADLMKLALVRVHRMLPHECQLLLTVHDSVLVEAPESMAVEVAEAVRAEIERPTDGFTIPLKAETNVGLTWRF